MTGMYEDCGDYTLSVARRVVLAIKKSSDLGGNAVEQGSSWYMVCVPTIENELSYAVVLCDVST